MVLALEVFLRCGKCGVCGEGSGGAFGDGYRIECIFIISKYCRIEEIISPCMSMIPVSGPGKKNNSGHPG